MPTPIAILLERERSRNNPTVSIARGSEGPHQRRITPANVRDVYENARDAYREGRRFFGFGDDPAADPTTTPGVVLSTFNQVNSANVDATDAQNTITAAVLKGSIAAAAAAAWKSAYQDWQTFQSLYTSSPDTYTDEQASAQIDKIRDAMSAAYSSITVAPPAGGLTPAAASTGNNSTMFAVLGTVAVVGVIVALKK